MMRLMIILLLFAGSASGEEPSSRFAEANTLYQAGKYKEAARVYEELAASGKSGALFYNLANASFRSGQKGKARLYYERALGLLPRDEDIRWNLEILKNALPDRMESPPEDIFLSFLKKTSQKFTMDELSVSFTLLLLVFAGAAHLGRTFSPAQPFVRFLKALLVALLVVNSALFFLRWLEVKDPRAVIMEKEITVRYGPTLRETKAFVLHEGSAGRVADETAEWFYLRFANGNGGWVPKNACEVI